MMQGDAASPGPSAASAAGIDDLLPPVEPAPHGDTAMPPDRFAYLDAPVRHWSEATPDAPAIGDAACILTYAALDAAVDAAASALAGGGVQPGARVMIVLENGVVAVVALLAAARLGAIVVPVNARLSAREIRAIADHCAPAAMLFCAGVSRDAASHGEAFGAGSDPVFGALGALLATRVDAAGDVAPVEQRAEATDRLAAFIYTSGTTGAPKGVMLTHDNLMFIAGRSSATRYLNGEDHVYGVLPMSHVFGLASVTLGSLYQGARLSLVPRFEAEAVARALAEDGVTIFQGVPQMHARLLSLAKVRGCALPAPRLRYISSGGAPLDLGLKAAMEAMWNQPLHNGYGLTETSPTVSTTATDAPSRDQSTGPLLPDVEVRIARPDGTALPAGEVGEIWVRGRLVMKGYYRDPEQTAAVLTPDGWFKSGDLGRLSAAGELYVVGRLKELIIRSGFNVFPPEVESVITRHPDVAIAAVVGRALDGNEEVVAFVQPVPGRAVDEASLRAFVDPQLAPYKRPTVWRIMDELPATATGKILKAQLKDMV